MSQEIVLDDDTYRTLSNLAAEWNQTPWEFLTKLIKNTDENAHVTWSRKQRKHIRVKCGLKGCKEKIDRPADAAD